MANEHDDSCVGYPHPHGLGDMPPVVVDVSLDLDTYGSIVMVVSYSDGTGKLQSVAVPTGSGVA